MSSYCLPPEIWLSIFRIATTCPAYQRLYEIDYTPFHDLPDDGELKMIGDVNSTKRSLVLVCKEWQVLAARFFYKDIRISHGLQGLYDSLKRSIDEVGGRGYGAFVRRIEFSMTEDENPDPGVRTRITLADVLELCPHVEIMTKTEDDLLHHVVNSDSTFESLKRFDWWYPTYHKGLHCFGNYEDPSHGINFLQDVVSRALNLRYLSIGRRSTQVATHDHNPVSLRFPALTTLRIENLRPYMSAEIQGWEFPCLTHLITDDTLNIFNLTRLGARVDVLELVNNRFMESLRRDSIVYPLLNSCPNLLELNFHIEFTFPLPEHETSNSPIQCIRLHATTNPRLRWYYELSGLVESLSGFDQSPSFWTHYENHFYVFSTTFPALERIVLHGDWNSIIQDSRFHLLKDPIVARGCVIQYDRDNGVVDALS